MGGSSSKQQTQGSTVNKVELPAWMSAAGQQTFNQARDLDPITAYTKQIAAGPSANSQAASAAARAAGGAPAGAADLDSARGMIARATGGSAPQGVDQSGAIGKINLALSGQPVDGPDYSRARGMIADATGGAVPQIGEAGEFDGAAAAKYMSPYRGAVQDSVMDAMNRQREIDMLSVGDGAQGSKAFGGLRHAVLEGQTMEAADRNKQQYLAASEQAAYENAQQQFERDRGARIGVDTTNAGFKAQGLDRKLSAAGMDASMASNEANFAAQQNDSFLNRLLSGAGLEANIKDTAAKTNAGIEGTFLDRLLSGAGLSSSIGQTESGMRSNAITDLLRTGVVDRQAEQDGLSAGYNEFLRMQDAPMDRMRDLAAILSGTPRNVTSSGTSNSTTTQQTGGGLFNNLLTGGLAAASMFSDPRLKTDAVAIGVHPTGATIYSFKYRHAEDGKRHIGVMADEVAEIVPEAVSAGLAGHAIVDYGKLKEAA